MNRPLLYDLHVHSTRSDGLRSVLELAHLASLSGLAGIAITDHDILPNTEIAELAREKRGVTILNGVEISTTWKNRRFHLLGYGFDATNSALASMVTRLLTQRRARWDALVERATHKGVTWDQPILNRQRDQGSPGRLHLARELVRLRRANSVRSAFERFLSDDESSLPALGVELSEAIEVLHDAGGVAVLAHPPTGMREEEWREIATLPLDGLETRFGRVANAHRRFLEARVAEYGWIATAGSDFHGDSSHARLGSHTVPSDVIDTITRRTSTPSPLP